MFVVYWLERREALSDNASHGGTARFELFDSSELTRALAFAEELRKKQAAGGDVGFVSLCSENPHSVGQPGVADPPADYAWKKRRR
ncbi:hypothetical protein [Paraburkholderia humisilvae]|uniref:Uncharacterized protein n=1 Tax=Paraburkholderia humisilvae TaxID=627669 RepID=A0A6J5D635_9BURK|nr:hypothetical protein [Paraburkholderia humisilvae]CAB3749839.1 hypothetical protein LMG29542_01123 [Paraburkholderia humisilvae]